MFTKIIEHEAIRIIHGSQLLTSSQASVSLSLKKADSRFRTIAVIAILNFLNGLHHFVPNVKTHSGSQGFFFHANP